MVYLIKNSQLIMTDSGGLQKEAYFFKKPCITLRNETEWIELIEHKFNVLVGANKKKILHTYQEFEFNKNFDLNLYGKGNASEIIINELKREKHETN
jgi:UDP-GlcNAc3NAcA epimerase